MGAFSPSSDPGTVTFQPIHDQIRGVIGCQQTAGQSTPSTESVEAQHAYKKRSDYSVASRQQITTVFLMNMALLSIVTAKEENQQYKSILFMKKDTIYLYKTHQ